MSTYEIMEMIDGQPCFEEPLQDILATCKEGGALKVLSPLENHTDRQRRWYKGVALVELAKNGDSVQWWDHELKKHCDGLALLKKEILLTDNGTPLGRLTIKGVGKRKMTAFINRILEVSMDKKLNLGWPTIPPPDPELRS